MLKNIALVIAGGMMLVVCSSSQSQEQPAATVDTPEVVATATPPATPTPTEPTATPEPTTTPEPIRLAGTGDLVVDVEKWPGPALASITGNAEGRYFGVTSMDTEGEIIDLLVGETEPYAGVRLIDYDTHTARFEIQAPGDWTIDILPLSEARVLVVPGRIEGEGDEVILLAGDTPDTAIISGNAESRYFGVLALGGTFPDLLVGETEPYEGMVAVDREAKILEIQAAGPWSIEITAR